MTTDRVIRRFLAGMLGLITFLTFALDGSAGEERSFTDAKFEEQIAPLIAKRCLGCHNASEASGELVLTTRKGLEKGGELGPAIDAEHLAESSMLTRVVDGEMPPEEDGKSGKLSDAEIALVREWILAGAPWPTDRTLSPYESTTEKRAGLDWWSLQSIERPTMPAVASNESLENPIDRFVQARLEKDGFEAAPVADRRTLLKRLYFDLVGFPPTYDEIESFANDPAADAYDREVDRLLASPHFGERWARYWLDLARYAETCGYERDQEKPGAWKYRDWVIDALNADMPYDEFVTEQLAGDEMPDRSEETVVATGFLRMGTWNDEPNDPLEYKYERLEDLVHTTSTAFLAMTVKCARCHDHKFDPIPQTDYYRVAAVFWAGHMEPRGSDLLGGPNKEELGYDVFGYTDRSRDPPPLQLLRKGDPHRPEQEIDPGYLSFVPALDQEMSPPPEDAQTTHRRLQFAQWLTDGSNPLPARVAVNRLWQHHFGAGLVRTPDNLGFNGDQPTHPQLLDWLASELIDGGWTQKRIHRAILSSRTYRQASVHPLGSEYRERDAGNHAWWHAERRRRDAESLRDSMLAVSSQIDFRMGGPSFRPEISSEALEGLSRKGEAWAASPADEQGRRSIYIYSKRSLLSPFMTTFDFADTSQSCAKRDVSIVAPQALALMNNAFVEEISEHIADKVVAEATSDHSERVRAAFRRCLGREPSEHETSISREHLETQAARFQDSSSGVPTEDPQRWALVSLCHVLINSNEFMFID